MAKVTEMTGYKFNGCTVLSRAGSTKDKKAMWECVCYCGEHFVTAGKSIRLNLTKSCGCLNNKNIKEIGAKNKTHGDSGSRLYDIWRGMKKRCRVTSTQSYKHYGAKGIDICDEWHDSYEVFKEWAIKNGYKDDLTIERIDSKGNYNPENCKWADWFEQANNRSNNIRMDYKGEKLTLSQIAKKMNISQQLLQYRLKNNIPMKFVKESDLEVHP